MTTIKVTKEGTKWWASFPYSFETKELVKSAGFRFDGTRKQWWTDRPENAAKLDGGNVVEIATRLNAEIAAKRDRDAAAIDASWATDAAIDVPVPEGLAYLPYQRAGIAYALSHANVLIADEMGLGKTIQAIGAINADVSLKRILVICPASLKLNWRNEMRKWLTRPMSIEIANGAFPQDADIVILNYDVLSKHRAAIDAVQWDLMICDESHYLKTPKIKRTTLVLGKWDRDETKRIAPITARRRLFLTGTPIGNRPKELWTLAQALDPQGLGRNWQAFHTRYCAMHRTKYGLDYDGASNLPELQAKMRSSFMIRRRKAEVLTELPPKSRQIIVLPAGSASVAVKAEADAFDKHEETIRRLQAEVEFSKASDNPADYEDAVAKLRDATQARFSEISRLRRETAVAKIPMAIEHIDWQLEGSDNKFVVFAHHHAVIDALAAKYGDLAVTLTGDTPMVARQAAVDRFQKDPSCRLFIGSFTAAGVGIILVASSHVIFCELDWVPGNLSQAEDRCHRIGQRDNVLVQHIVLDGSLDARMAGMLVAKQEILDAALDKGAALPEAEKLMVPVEAPSTREVTRVEVERTAPTVSPEKAQAVLTCLQILAGVCDGAWQRDGAGFNRNDTFIGHKFAALSSLTAKQAVLGARIVQKYWRQLPAELLAVTKKEA